MKKYSLDTIRCTEFEGYSITSFYSKGHHDKKEFSESIVKDWEWDKEVQEQDIVHCYGKLVPSPTGNMMLYDYKEKRKGSFPMTILFI